MTTTETEHDIVEQLYNESCCHAGPCQDGEPEKKPWGSVCRSAETRRKAAAEILRLRNLVQGKMKTLKDRIEALEQRRQGKEQ